MKDLRLHLPSIPSPAESFLDSHSPPQKSLVTVFSTPTSLSSSWLVWCSITCCLSLRRVLRWRSACRKYGAYFRKWYLQGSKESRPGQGQTSGCDKVTTEASITSQDAESWDPSLRQEAQPLHLSINWSLDMRCPWKEGETLTQMAFFSWGLFLEGSSAVNRPSGWGMSECLSPEVGGVWVAYHDIHHPIFFFLLSTHIFLLAWLCLINICSLISRILGLSSSYATNLSLSLTWSLSLLQMEHLPSMA